MNQFQFELLLDFDPERSIVTVDLIPTLTASAVTRERLMAMMEAQGYADYYLFDEAIDQFLEHELGLRAKAQKIYGELLRRLVADTPAADLHGSVAESIEPADSHGIDDNKAKEINAADVFAFLNNPATCFDIAEKQDAVIEVTTSEDHLFAYLNVTRAFGGEPASKQAILHELKKMSIGVSLVEKTIDDAVESGECVHQLVARGILPKKGRDSQFEVLVKDQVRTGPEIDEQGNANYLDVNEFVVVEVGQALMRRLPPLPGKGGKDVFGRSIPAETGDLIPFASNLEGSEASPADSNVLVATEKGHPVIFERGVSVDPILHLTNVSLATGNIDFDGSVHVAEDVADGLIIRASGDVVISGVVGKATIIAGNSVVIQQGLIGGVASEDEVQDKRYGAEVKAGGAVSARFVTMATIQAETDISISEYALHSKLVANTRVLIGEKSGRGSLIGGYTQAFDLVSAKVLGSKGSVITAIRVGAPEDTVGKLRHLALTSRQKNEKAFEMRQKLHLLKIRSRSMNPFAKQTEGTIKSLELQLKGLEEMLSEYQAKEDKLKKLLLRSKKSRVSARMKVYQNVEVDILGSRCRVQEDSIGGHFSFDVRRVVFSR